jgi:hypothetical protein
MLAEFRFPNDKLSDDVLGAVDFGPRTLKTLDFFRISCFVSQHGETLEGPCVGRLKLDETG